MSVYRDEECTAWFIEILKLTNLTILYTSCSDREKCVCTPPYQLGVFSSWDLSPQLFPWSPSVPLSSSVTPEDGNMSVMLYNLPSHLNSYFNKGWLREMSSVYLLLAECVCVWAECVCVKRHCSKHTPVQWMRQVALILCYPLCVFEFCSLVPSLSTVIFHYETWVREYKFGVWGGW